MNKEIATLGENELLDEELTKSFNFDDLEEKLQHQIDEELADIEFLVEEKEKIGSPDNLGKVVTDVVWEQFLNQIAVTAGEDFIADNNNLHLDLSNDAHIQTTENFSEGKIATHNTEINYKQRHEDWQSNFVKDETGSITTHKTRSGMEQATLKKGARKPFDKGRPTGSTETKTDMDHTVSAGEIVRDAAANAHMTKDEQITFANSSTNLNEMNSSQNRSKSDMSMSEWLDNPNANGQKPDEIFDISAEDEAMLRKKDAEARKEYEKQKEEAENRSVAVGKKSQKDETFRIGGKALRAVLMQMLAELVKEIIGKLVKWFKSGKKTLSSLLDKLKESIFSFIGKMKTHLINAGNTVISTVATAIIGPIFGTIKKAWMLLKQGWSSLKTAINYIKDPANKGKPIGILLMEVGKIVTVGLAGGATLILGEVIEKGLMAIPIFAIEIPLIGSLANILGIFLGAVVAGIIGAVAINLIEKQIEKRLKQEKVDTQIEKGNKVLNLQHQVQIINETKLEDVKVSNANIIQNRHEFAANALNDSIESIETNCEIEKNIQETFDDIDMLLDRLED